MGFFGKLKNLFTRGTFKDDEQLTVEREETTRVQEELERAEVSIEPKKEEVDLIVEETKKEIPKSPSIKVPSIIETESSEEVSKEMDNFEKTVKRTKTFETEVGQFIETAGVKKIKINPTSSIDDSNSYYKSLLEDKLTTGDEETRNAIIDMAIMGREHMKDRFTMDVVVSLSNGQDVIITYYGVMIEHSEPVGGIFQIGQEIDADYDLKSLANGLQNALKQRGSGTTTEYTMSSFPTGKHKITNVQAYFDFA